MTQKRCATPGCGRFVGAAAQWCRRHRQQENGQIEALAGDFPELVSDELDEAAAEFQRRLTAGDYRTLFGDRLNAVIQQAASEPGLADEIGILRVVLARILIEERNPAQLAASVSRVVGVAIHAARAQRVISEEQIGVLSQGLKETLEEIGNASR